jgi:hypothetical protein
MHGMFLRAPSKGPFCNVTECAAATKIAETGVASAARVGRVLLSSTVASKFAASVVGQNVLAVAAWRTSGVSWS